MRILNKKTTVLSFLIGVGLLSFLAAPTDEGMYPLSDLNRAGLKKAGLKISEKDIYNPGNVGLVDALVQVGGCTGSFISEEGLIITNHHCAFGAVQKASTPENDYLTHGFVAPTHEQEIEAKGLSIRITESYEDVSTRVLAAASTTSDPVTRLRLIADEREKIAREAEAGNPAIKAEVSEMFIGRSYVLFRYKTIEDVRLVYVPERNIGEFGGETDNWVWPRHTGDFAFLRAYVSPDGQPAGYSKQNVPYKPKKHLKINPKGVNEEDFVFILGYPGRTFRHRPYQYLEYQQRFLLPYTAGLYAYQNQVMEEAGEEDKATEIQLATRIKRNANVMKNYQGKLKGLRNIGLVEQKKQEDEALAQFISNHPELRTRYGNLMNEADALYQLIFSDARREMWINQIYNSSNLLNIARYVNSLKTALQQTPADKQQQLFDANKATFSAGVSQVYQTYNLYTDKHHLARMLADAADFDSPNQIDAVQKTGVSNEESALSFVAGMLDNTRLQDKDFVLNTLFGSPGAMLAYTDDLLVFQEDLNRQIVALQPETQRREGVLSKLMADYVAVKEQYQQKSFIPDANSTLRLTYGYIRGYSPADATYMKPFTTLKGVLEKGASGAEEFRYPQRIRDRWQARDFGPYIKKELNDIPVNILYDMDTTGGNSGSPIMNARGELIGVNFDRAYDATINDFAWNQSYSRSIGVDIRYVLWVADKVDNAGFLLKEIGL